MENNTQSSSIHTENWQQGPDYITDALNHHLVSFFVVKQVPVVFGRLTETEHFIACKTTLNISWLKWLSRISPEFQLVQLLPQGCQHPPLLGPGLPRLLVVLGALLSDVENNHPWSMEVVLGPDKVVVLLPRPDVGPAAGVSQPEEGVIPVHLPSLVCNPSRQGFTLALGESMKSNLEYQS